MGGLTAVGLVKLFSLVAQLVEGGVAVAAAVQAGSEALDKFQAEERDPTDEELDALRTEIVERGNRIQDA